MKFKLQSLLAFCGISSLAAVYCYYFVSNKKHRKQTSSSKFLAAIDPNCAQITHSEPTKEERHPCREKQEKQSFEPLNCDQPSNSWTNSNSNPTNNSIDTGCKVEQEVCEVVKEKEITSEVNSSLEQLSIIEMCDDNCNKKTPKVDSPEHEHRSVPGTIKLTNGSSDEDIKNRGSPVNDLDDENISWASIVEETFKEHMADCCLSAPSENSIYSIVPDKSPVNKQKPSKSSNSNCQKLSEQSNTTNTNTVQRSSRNATSPKSVPMSGLGAKKNQQKAQTQPQFYPSQSQYQKQLPRQISNHKQSNFNSRNNSNCSSENSKANNKGTNSNKSAKNKSSEKDEHMTLSINCNGNTSDCSNQENEPETRKRLVSKKSPVVKLPAPAVNGSACKTSTPFDPLMVPQGYDLSGLGATMEQIYLNDPSVISVISPNFSEADSAVISCGEHSLTSIPYISNGIPSPSETSTDSGMIRSSGSPEYFNPPLEEYLSWEVEIPTHVGGKIIGKGGRNVKELREKTGCKVIIKDIENSRRKQLLVVRGTLDQIQTCHRLLEKKFKKEIEFESGIYYTMEGLAGFLGYPMPQTITAPTQILPAPNTYLHLPQSAYFDVIVCNIQTAGHFFLQQPTHNSFFNLDRLHDCMRECYRDPSVPELPSPIHLGTISAAFLDGKWCRSQVVGVTSDENVITVRFLDAGGYREMPRHNVKQIRTDFLSLPFQATEVFLSEVTPANDQAEFGAEATEFLKDLLSQSGTPQAFLKGWNMSDMPLVDLIVRREGKFESVAKLLIEHGYAAPLEMPIASLS